LTLANGTTAGGAVYAGNTRLTTHYPANSIMIMVWNGSEWRTNPYYNTDNDYRTRQIIDDSITTNRALLFSHYAPTTATSNTAAVTYRCAAFYVNPDTETLYATNFNGALTGNAATATSWASNQTAYVDLSTAGIDSTINGGQPSAQVLKVYGTLAVSNGGTGVNNFPASSIIVSGAADSGKTTSTAPLTTRGIYTLTTKGEAGWSTSSNRTKIPDMNFIAFWNGAYSGTSSHLEILGTITTGTWNATKIGTGYGGTGNDTFTANRLVYSESDTKLSSTTSIYAGTDVITINGTDVPANSGKFQVKGISTL